VVNSFGLQNAMDKSAVDVSHFFARCHTAASTCAMIARDELGPGGYLRYSPDSHFVQLSYAVLTLLKVSNSKARIICSDLCTLLANSSRVPTIHGERAENSQFGNGHSYAIR
jgi:hypothetical protein